MPESNKNSDPIYRITLEFERLWSVLLIVRIQISDSLIVIDYYARAYYCVTNFYCERMWETNYCRTWQRNEHDKESNRMKMSKKLVRNFIGIPEIIVCLFLWITSYNQWGLRQSILVIIRMNSFIISIGCDKKLERLENRVNLNQFGQYSMIWRIPYDSTCNDKTSNAHTHTHAGVRNDRCRSI